MDNNFLCPNCHKNFKTQGWLTRHQQECQPLPSSQPKKSTFKCEKCGNVFTNRSSLTRHQFQEDIASLLPLDKTRLSESPSHEEKIECPKCGQLFKSKSGLTSHLHRKIPCVEVDITQVDITEVEIPRVEGTNECSIISNVNAEYVYLLQEREHVQGNDPVYKIGRTAQEFGKRFAGYPKDSIIYIIMKVDDSRETEKNILEHFRNEFGCRRDVGDEYFSCKDINKMIKRFFEICYYGE